MPGRKRARYTFNAALAARSNRLTLIRRYETRLHRLYQRALPNLLLIRKTFPLPRPTPGRKKPD